MMKKTGITKASVSLATMKGRFSFLLEKVGPRDIITMLESLGFEVELANSKTAGEHISQKFEIRK